MNCSPYSPLALACILPIAADIAPAAEGDVLFAQELVARELVIRVTPQYAGRIRFNIVPQLQSAHIEGKGRYVYINAPDVSECIRAYGYYLRHIARVHFSWNGDCTAGSSFIVPTRRITVPAALPFNYALNYCTLSYTTVTWDKKRWERELDIMALNGVKYVLVTSGLEKVWQNFLTELEYPQDKIAAFIPNPCYAAWWNMGNLEGEGGPLSQTLIDSEAELGRFLVKRLKSLGMEPVLQGYVGFLPHDFPKAGINGKLLPQGKWCGYHRPAVLQPTAPGFDSIAELWYKHLHAVYGTTAKAYGGDLFHEGGRKGDTDLGRAAQAVQRAMQKASPGSYWLIQAWGHNPDKKLLNGTDPQHTVILALQKNLSPKAETNFDYAGRPFVWCELSNFGGKHGMFGGMELLENFTRDKSKAIGIGMISEGLETSPFYYELLWTRMNTAEAIERASYIQRYTQSRYGVNNQQLHKALHLLANSIYNTDKKREGSLENIICARPDLKVRKATTWADPTMYYSPLSVHTAAELYLEAGKQLGEQLTSQITYRHDLADLCRQVLADRARATLARCKNAFERKDEAAFRKESQLFLTHIRDTAAVLATSEHFLLGRFVDGARKRGTTPQDKEAMERALLQLITTWRPDISVLNDYSHRQFAEMMEHYYLPRWQMYFNARLNELKTGVAQDKKIEREITYNNGEAVELEIIRNPEMENFELKFRCSDIPMFRTPQGDILSLAEKILH